MQARSTSRNHDGPFLALTNLLSFKTHTATPVKAICCYDMRSTKREQPGRSRRGACEYTRAVAPRT